MAPHVKFWIVARGINIGLNTRLYFSDEDEADALDPVLKRIEQPSRRKRLIAEREQRDNNVVYKFDIYLRRERETVFFDV
jgi:protocatechuate 3,4-dioxygenase, alpha subunit